MKNSSDNAPARRCPPHKYIADGPGDFFRWLALGCCVCSLISVLTLALALPHLFDRMATERAEMATKAGKFKADSNQIWSRMLPDPSTTNNDQMREKRATRAGCGCATLNCAPGQPGDAGPAGPDGVPGQPGNPGEGGRDGFDILMETELDMPCVICPPGPPGQRGSQGERGAMGHNGPTGLEGVSGKEGNSGPEGPRGPSGNLGPKGEAGMAGPSGDQIVAGIGVAGPKGMTGSAGMPGPPGLAGRRSMTVGMSGPLGQAGPPGAQGNPGRPGDQGEIGQVGEPGMPSMYCAADCGVSHIRVPEFSKIPEQIGKSDNTSQSGGGNRQYGTVQHKLWGQNEEDDRKKDGKNDRKLADDLGKDEDDRKKDGKDDRKLADDQKEDVQMNEEDQVEVGDDLKKENEEEDDDQIRRHPSGGYYKNNARLVGGPS